MPGLSLCWGRETGGSPRLVLLREPGVPMLVRYLGGEISVLQSES